MNITNQHMLGQNMRQNAKQGQALYFTSKSGRLRVPAFQPSRTRAFQQPVCAAVVDEVSAPTQQKPSKETDFQQAVGILKQAAKTKTVPGALVMEAMVKLGKQSLANDSYADILGGGPDGKRWELIFSADSKNTQKANKKEKASGIYFPLVAAQWWQKETGTNENGVFLGQIAALVLSGPYEYKKNKLSFDFNKLKIRLGPKWFTFDIASQKKEKKSGFFIFSYADEDIIVAKGKAGGIALWAKASPTWELKNGIGNI